MIFDKIENIKKYNIDLEFIISDLKEDHFIPGRSEINSDEQFVIGLEYETKDEKEALWEAHRKYLDIHIILEGDELIYISDITKMISHRDYEEDYELFEGNREHIIHLQPGHFLMLFPNEVHKTSVFTDKKKLIRKKVFKKLIVND